MGWVIVNKIGDFWCGGKAIPPQNESWCGCRNGATCFENKRSALIISKDLDGSIVINLDKNPSEQEIEERIKKDFYISYNWVNNHPALYDAKNEDERMDREIEYGDFLNTSVSKLVVLVDEEENSPLVGRWDDKNLQSRVWLESGPIEKLFDEPYFQFPKTNFFKNPIRYIKNLIEKKYLYKLNYGGLIWSHDINLDCGGKTFEEAVCNLAKLIAIHYGEYDNEEYPF